MGKTEEKRLGSGWSLTVKGLKAKIRHVDFFLGQWGAREGFGAGQVHVRCVCQDIYSEIKRGKGGRGS